jgi:hypothetical protein
MMGLRTGRVKAKDNNIGICYFSTNHAELKDKSNDWLAQNQDNVSEQHVYQRTDVSVS